MGGKGTGKAMPPPPVKMSAEEKEQQKLKAKEAAEAARQAEMAPVLENKAKRAELQERLPSCIPHEIHEVPWATAKLNLHIPGGKGTVMSGVRVVEFEDGKVVCLRMEGLDTDTIALHVANCLGTRIAQFRLVHPSNPEWQAIDDCLLRTDPELQLQMKEIENYRTNNPEAWKAVTEAIEKARVSKAVLEFVPGFAMDKSAALSSASKDDTMFLSLGRICALDMVINNMDRLPLTLWDAEWGNLTNVMISQASDVVGIDQQVNPISDPTGMEEYLGRVRSFSTHILRSDFSHIALQAASEKLRKAVGNSLSQGHVVTIFKGMREGIIRIAEVWDNGELKGAMTAAGEAAKIVTATPTDVPCEAYTAFVLKVAEEVTEVVHQLSRRGSI